MILIKGREMLISNREQYLGSTADNNSEVRIFKIDRLRSVDIAHLMFKIDLEYSNGGKDSCSLEKEVTEESIFLQWTIPSEVLQVPGPIFGNIRATDEIGAVKWSSFCGVFYSEEAINTPGAWEGKLTELEKTEVLVEEYKKSAESAASEAEASKNEAKEAKETTVSAMNDAISAKKVSVESANAAVEAKTEAEYARDAAQLAKEQTEQISGAGIATTEKVGLVRPDGETVEVGETGLIKVPKATTEKHGLVRPDGETIGLENDLLKSLVTAAGLKTNDTNGLLGTENAEVMLQALIDNITNRVVNQILTKTMLVNNALTTEEGKFPADAAYLKVLKGLIDQNKESIRQLNGKIGVEYWSGVGAMDNITIKTWNRSTKSITIPPGTYIIGYRVQGSFLNEIYVSTKVDTSEQNLGLYEKELHLPMTSTGSTIIPRSVNNVMMRNFNSTTTLYVWIYTGVTVSMDYEVWAVRIK